MRPTTLQIEIAVARMFNPRQNIIVPNVSWGMGFRHECDVLVLRASGWAVEIEIKTTASDLRADLKKPHGHSSNKIRELIYAMPDDLTDLAIDILPADVGILAVVDAFRIGWKCKVIRKAKPRKHARKMTKEEQFKIAHLGTMRIWTLKNTIDSIRSENIITQ